MEDFLNPREVLDKLNLKEDMAAADFGSGSGGWVLPLAKILGKGLPAGRQGKVYAIDVLKEPLSALQSKASLQKLLNIQTIRSNVEGANGSKLPDSSVDLILMTNLLFQVEDKKAVLEEAKRALKNKGQILVVDWLPESVLGPKEGRLSPADVREIADKIGLKCKKDFMAGSCHWGMVLVK